MREFVLDHKEGFTYDFYCFSSYHLSRDSFLLFKAVINISIKILRIDYKDMFVNWMSS